MASQWTDLDSAIQNNNRINQQNINPGAVKARALPTNIIQNSTTFISGAFSLSNGSALSIQSILTSDTNPDVPLAGVPYCIAFFEGSLGPTKIIGAGVSGSGYIITGPFAMPKFSPLAQNTSSSTINGGSDGNNLVFITQIYNNTGLTKTIYYATNTRFIQGAAGGAS